jgi:hypothetical protein
MGSGRARGAPVGSPPERTNNTTTAPKTAHLVGALGARPHAASVTPPADAPRHAVASQRLQRWRGHTRRGSAGLNSHAPKANTDPLAQLLHDLILAQDVLVELLTLHTEASITSCHRGQRRARSMQRRGASGDADGTTWATDQGGISYAQRQRAAGQESGKHAATARDTHTPHSRKCTSRAGAAFKCSAPCQQAALHSVPICGPVPESVRAVREEAGRE